MNPRPLPYQGSALPPELYQRISLIGLKVPINVANTMPKPIPMQEPIMHAFLKSLLLYVPEKRKAAIKPTIGNKKDPIPIYHENNTRFLASFTSISS